MCVPLTQRVSPLCRLLYSLLDSNAGRDEDESMSAAARPSGPARRGAGSQRALRQANTRRIVETLRRDGPSTQAALARATGLSSATVSNLVRMLVDEGAAATSATTSSGRRATLVRLVDGPRSRIAVGVDVGRRHLTVIACTAAREVLAEVERPLPADHRPDETVTIVREVLADVLERTGRGPGDVVGCGIGIPGPIDARTGQISHGAILPEWVGLRLADRFAEGLGLPVHVHNDADLGAVAETSWGPHQGVDDLVYVKVGTGIGAGLVVGGRPCRGATGITGEIGHTSVAEFGPVCRCGARGCLESVASAAAITSLVAAGRGAGPVEVADVVAGSEAGDPLVLRVVQDAGLALGRVLGIVTNLVGPRVIVVGGPLAGLGEALLQPVRLGIARATTSGLPELPEVVASTLAGRAEALGACTEVIRQAPQGAWI